MTVNETFDRRTMTQPQKGYHRKMDNNQVNNYDNNSNRGNGGPGNGSNGGNGNNNNNGKDPKKQSIIIMITAAVLSLLCISYFTRAVSGATTVEIPYNKFIEMLDAGTVESVKIESSPYRRRRRIRIPTICWRPRSR